MAGLPDGWIFIPKIKIVKEDGETVAKVFNEERVLVMCKNCKYHDEDGQNFCDCGNRPDDWFCADGEPK